MSVTTRAGRPRSAGGLARAIVACVGVGSALAVVTPGVGAVVVAGAMVAGACAVGRLAAERMRQPGVVGELAAAILLGPAALGALAPEAFGMVFTPMAMTVIGAAGKVGVVVLAFRLGRDLDNSVSSRTFRRATLVSLAATMAPLAAGCVVAAMLKPPLRDTQGGVASVIFVGVALSITAFPVLARMLDDTGLRRTPVGQMALTAAAMSDAIAWLILSVLAALGEQAVFAGMARLLLAVAAVAVITFVVVAMRSKKAAEPRPAVGARPSHPHLLAAAVIAASHVAGLHLVFGSFVAGLILRSGQSPRDTTQHPLPAVDRVFLPLFFFHAGHSLDLRDLSPHHLSVAALIIAIAISTKVIAAGAAAWRVGFPARQVLALGVLLNTRGVTELIVLRVGLDLNVLSPSLYTILTLGAVVTTVMTVPALRVLGLDKEVCSGAPQ